MEKELLIPLDKYLADTDSLQNWYPELQSQLKIQGFLESLAKVLVHGESQTILFQKCVFHGKFQNDNIFWFNVHIISYFTLILN